LKKGGGATPLTIQDLMKVDAIFDPHRPYQYLRKSEGLSGISRKALFSLNRHIVRGRLMISSIGKCCVLVDSSEHLDARHETAKDREEDFWNSTRRHQQHAGVKENRWATRSGYLK
jgi:hypothetical protein